MKSVVSVVVSVLALAGCVTAPLPSGGGPTGAWRGCAPRGIEVGTIIKSEGRWDAKTDSRPVRYDMVVQVEGEKPEVAVAIFLVGGRGCDDARPVYTWYRPITAEEARKQLGEEAFKAMKPGFAGTSSM